MNEVRCPCCDRRVRRWYPWRMDQQLFVVFKCPHCGIHCILEARYEVVRRDRYTTRGPRRRP